MTYAQTDLGDRWVLGDSHDQDEVKWLRWDSSTRLKRNSRRTYFEGYVRNRKVNVFESRNIYINKTVDGDQSKTNKQVSEGSFSYNQNRYYCSKNQKRNVDESSKRRNIRLYDHREICKFYLFKTHRYFLMNKNT